MTTATTDEFIAAVLAAGRYHVDAAGRIYNSNYKGGGRPRKLLTAAHSRGYRRVYLTDESGAHCMCYAHRVVAIATLGPPPGPEYQVNHRDGDKANNTPDNLEWATQNGNMKHAYDTGLSTKPPSAGMWGVRNHRAKLDESQVREIHRRLNAGETNVAIGAHFGVTDRTISNIRLGRSWPHIYREFHPDAAS